MDQIFKLHGMPTSIVSDRDPIFTSNFWQELFRLQGTQLKLSTSYHPQTDGQTEVVNKCLETYLRCFTSEKQHLWVQWLSLAEWWYNTNYHATTKILRTISSTSAHWRSGLQVGFATYCKNPSSFPCIVPQESDWEQLQNSDPSTWIGRKRVNLASTRIGPRHTRQATVGLHD